MCVCVCVSVFVCGRCVNRPVEAEAAAFRVAAGSKSRVTFAGMQRQQ